MIDISATLMYYSKYESKNKRAQGVPVYEASGPRQTSRDSSGSHEPNRSRQGITECGACYQDSCSPTRACTDNLGTGRRNRLLTYLSLAIWGEIDFRLDRLVNIVYLMRPNLSQEQYNCFIKDLSMGILYKLVNKKEHQPTLGGLTDAPTPYLQGGMT